MIDHFIDFVIRPPRANYIPAQYLGENTFTLARKKYTRQDLELANERGHRLRCSHYVPLENPDNAPLPCVIYCHGNSGCRAEGKEAVALLLPLNITVFTLDFSGSGLSDGDYVSLGWHEKDDLKSVVSYLRSSKRVSRIGLWGRSMGAVTSLLYGAEDPTIAGMVLDSAFSNLFDLMVELADLYDLRIPKFTVKMVLLYLRRAIRKKAKFDIMRLDCVKVACKSFAPALFAHGEDDRLILPKHSDAIFNAYMGKKNILRFDGDHNSNRPKIYYESVSNFFFSNLRPPVISSSHATNLEKQCDLRDLIVTAGTEEVTLSRSVSVGTTSSSCAFRSLLDSKSLGEFLAEAAAVWKDQAGDLNEDCYSLTSSTRESWGSHMSGSGDDAYSQDCTSTSSRCQVTPVRNSQQDTRMDQKQKNKLPSGRKKSTNEKLEKLETLGQRLRYCFQKGAQHARHCSS